MQRLQFFLSVAAWDGEAINPWRLALLCADTATAAVEPALLVSTPPGGQHCPGYGMRFVIDRLFAMPPKSGCIPVAMPSN